MATSFILKPRTIIVSVASFALVAGLLVAARDLTDASELLSWFDPIYLLAGLAAHFLTLFLNALRIRHSLQNDTPSRIRGGPVMDLIVLHNFLVSFLPARLADGYYPLLVARRTGVSLGVGIGNLVLLRIFDVMAIAVVIVALAPLALGAAQLGQLYFIVLPLLVFLLLASVRLHWIFAWALALGRRPARRVRLLGHAFRAANQARRWILGRTGGQRAMLALLSLLPWIVSSVTYVFVAAAIGMDLTWAQAMLAGKLAELGAAVPVQMAGGIGVGEGFMAATLVGFGAPLGLAVMASVAFRVAILGIVAVIFLIRCGVVLLIRTSPSVESGLFSALFGPDYGGQRVP